jgi:hypothetical protein
MEWYLNIPKIFHVYWGGGKINYLRFMTIKTFIKHNPDWKVMFLYPKQHTRNITWNTKENKNQILLCKDFTSELNKLPINKIEIDFKKYNVSNSLSEVHKSDFIRLIQLNKIGGLWSDMDIFYIKPMTSFYLNTPENKNIETFVCNNIYGHSIGFMMASKGNKFFETLVNLAYKEYQPQDYQTLGSLLYNKHFGTMDSINKITPAINISMDVVYPSYAGDEANLINGKDIKITDRTLGVHWYAGHPQWTDFLLKTNGGLTNVPDNCIIGKLLKNKL